MGEEEAAKKKAEEEEAAKRKAEEERAVDPKDNKDNIQGDDRLALMKDIGYEVDMSGWPTEYKAWSETAANAVPLKKLSDFMQDKKIERGDARTKLEKFMKIIEWWQAHAAEKTAEEE